MSDTNWVSFPIAAARLETAFCGIENAKAALLKRLGWALAGVVDIPIEADGLPPDIIVSDPQFLTPLRRKIGTSPPNHRLLENVAAAGPDWFGRVWQFANDTDVQNDRSWRAFMLQLTKWIGGNEALFLDASEVDGFAVVANLVSPIEKLFGHWQQVARRDYQMASDQVSAKVSATGNVQGSAHIKLLSDAAESCVFAMLRKARAMPISPESYPIALSSSCALLVELGADIRAIAIGANGRRPAPDNAIFANNLINGANARIEAEIEKWSLEDRIASANHVVRARQVVRLKAEAKPSSELLPRLPDAKLTAWWGKLPTSDRELSLDKLLELSRSAFPSNSIARQRVRNLDPGRKRGPKPLSGKTTA